MAVEWSRPRVTPFAGHRKATLRFCNECQEFHRTHRHQDGEQPCPGNGFKVTVETEFPAIISKLTKSRG